MVPEFSVVMLTTQDNPRMIFPFIALSVCNHTGEPSPQISYRHPGWPLSELESDREILRSSSKMESFSEKVQSTQTQTQYLLGLKHGNEPFSPPHPPVLMMSPNKYALINKISHATVSFTLPSTLAIRFSPDKSIPKHRMCLQRFVRTLFASQQLNHFNLKKKKKINSVFGSLYFIFEFLFSSWTALLLKNWFSFPKSSYLCSKSRHHSQRRWLDKSQSARWISLEMEAVWSPPILMTSVWTEEEFIATLVPFPVGSKLPTIKEPVSPHPLCPRHPALLPAKTKTKKKKKNTACKDKTCHQGSSSVVISPGIMIDDDQQSVG